MPWMTGYSNTLTWPLPPLVTEQVICASVAPVGMAIVAWTVRLPCTHCRLRLPSGFVAWLKVEPLEVIQLDSLSPGFTSMRHGSGAAGGAETNSRLLTLL